VSRTERLWLLIALALGALVRILPVITAAAAVGDGGLFVAMTNDIRSAGFALPETTSYNDLGIPFAYPPLALYIAAAVSRLSGASSLDVITWMPLVVSMLCLGAFAWVAARVLPPIAAIGAAFAYALMPHAYDWVIAGGGVTRGMGLLFALVAIGVVAVRSQDSFRPAILAGLLLGLSALSHGQAAIFGIVGCIAVSVSPPLRPWLTRLGVAAACAVAVALPWLVVLIGMHGPEVLLSVGHRLEPTTGLIRVANLRFAGAPFMDVFVVTGVIGLITSSARRQLRLPALLLATYLLGAGGGEFLGMVPWALVCGVGFRDTFQLVEWGLEGASARTARFVMAAIGVVGLFLALTGSLGSVTDKSSKLHSLTAGQIAAMEWVAANTPADARLMVPTNEWWGDDEVSEWVPALTERRSIATVQGSEWLGPSGFEAQVRRHIDVLRCSGATAACYRAIDTDAVLFVPKGRLAGPFSNEDCCPALRDTLADAGYEIIYDGPGATIAKPAD
jgi:hypothetical protein